MSIVNRPRGVPPFRLASVNPPIWLDCESQRAALTAGGAATLFQDSGGTLPVTAVEQLTGRVTDLSGNGRHGLQITSPARPVLTARENLLLATEDFGSPAWTKFSLGSGAVPTVAPNTAAAPDGSMTADVINFSATASGAGSFVEQTITAVSGQQYADAIQLRAATPGDVGKVVLLRGVAGLGYMPITLTADWVRYTRTETAGSASGPFTLGLRFGFSGSATAASVAVYAAHRNTGATAGRYQRVTTATNYDISAAPLMMRFDGADDGIASATFPAGTLPENADAYLVVWPDADEQECVFVEDPSSSGARYFGVRHPSQAISQSADGPTTASAAFTVNGSPIAGTTNPTRTQLFTATQTGVPVLLQITGLNLSAWTQVGLGRYVNNATGFGYKGRHGCLFISEAKPASVRRMIRKDLAKRYQITGVI